MDNVKELGEEIASLSAHLDAATHRLLECIRRFDEAEGWHDQGAISCAHWLAWRIGWDPATAREKVRVARALGKLPAVDEALRLAKLSYAKVRALTRVATPDNEAKLLRMALIATAAQLERICRGYRMVQDLHKTRSPEERLVNRRQLPGGMVRLEMVLEPDEADLVLRAIERAREVRAQQAQPHKPTAAEELTAQTAGVSAEAPWPSRADGAVKLAESFLAGNPVTGTGGERFQVIVHLDQEVLDPDFVVDTPRAGTAYSPSGYSRTPALAERAPTRGAWAGTLEDGTRVSAETLRRVACDCGLVATGHDGEALNIGRRARTIPPAIRRALMLRDHGCAFPGCTHTAFLHGHHIEHWLHGGETSLDNLVMLCTFHHHLVHEGGWTVTAVAEGAFGFRSPSGKMMAPVPPRELVSDSMGWLREWADAHNLDLGPGVNMPQWDGKSPDYNSAVGWLLAAGQ